jgi:hypothetical protein
MYDDAASISLGGTPASTRGSMNLGSRTTFVIYSASLVYYVASHSRDASRAADSDAHVSVRETRWHHQTINIYSFSLQFVVIIVIVLDMVTMPVVKERKLKLIFLICLCTLMQNLCRTLQIVIISSSQIHFSVASTSCWLCGYLFVSRLRQLDVFVLQKCDYALGDGVKQHYGKG